MVECAWMNVNVRTAKIANYFQKTEKQQLIIFFKNVIEIKMFLQMNYYLYKLVMDVNVNLLGVKKNIVNVTKEDKSVETNVLVKIV